MKHTLLVTSVAIMILQIGCSKEAAFESIKVVDEAQDKSIVEPEEREFKSYRDYQKKREEILRDNEKTD